MNRKSIEVLCVALIASSSSQAATFTGLGSLSNSEFYSTAAAVSADGSTVIGTTTSLSGSEGFYWASNISMTGIGMMSAVPDDLYTQAIAVSGDGSFIVGKAQNNDNLSFLFNEFNEPTGFSLPSKVSAFVYSMNGEYQDLGKLVEPTPVSLDPVCPS